jgi:hypothetical protein
MEYRRRIRLVKAIQYTGLNKFKVCEFCKGTKFDAEFKYYPINNIESILLSILDETLLLLPSDYLVKMDDGTFRVYCQERFEEVYEKVEE